MVSVIVPVRNERGYIGAFLDRVFTQIDMPSFEVIVADGLSDDGTRELLDERAGQDKRLLVLANEGRIVSTGLNAAIRAARGEVIVRLDVHTDYAPDYLARSVAMLKSSGADNVGGPWRAKGTGYMQSAIALAFQSPFASGGASSRRVNYEGPVDSVYLGCWRRDTLLRVGLFDENLVRNQDDELNLRLIRGGGTVWQSPLIQSYYHPRSSLLRLFHQYAQYGYWKVAVIQKHRLPASVRHLIPAGFVASVLLLSVAALFSTQAWWVLVALCSVYFGLCLGLAVLTCRKAGDRKYLPVMPVVFMAYHLGYGTGFWSGLFDFVLLRRGGRKAYSVLTR
ncbi:MAG: glycosyltransferase family 2 protein [Opitutaceae bacterium]